MLLNIKNLFIFIVLAISVLYFAPTLIDNNGQELLASSNPLTVYCFASPNIIYKDQKISWSAVASGGSGRYTYNWSGTDELFGDSAYVSKTYSTAGAKNAIVTVVSGNSSATVRCNAIILSEWPPLSVSCSAAAPLNLVNQRVIWSAKVGGGNGRYVYEWSGDVFGKTANVSNLYDTTGTKIATLKVTSAGLSSTVQCNTEVLSSWPPLSASCSVAPAPALVNQIITWSAKASGGNNKYSYSWHGNDGFSGSSVSVSGRYTTRGTKTASVTVSDTAGHSVTVPCTNSLSVGSWPRFSVSCSTSLQTALVGQQFDWIAVASGGNRTYKGGEKPLQKTLSDSDQTEVSSEINTSSDNANKKTCTFNLDCPWNQFCNNGVCSDSSNVTITNSYLWSGDVSGTSYIMSVSYKTPGIKNANVKVTDSKGKITTNNCSINILPAPLKVYCYSSSSLASPNQRITWTAGASGGAGSYAYNWMGSEGLLGSSSSVSKTYLNVGLKTATVSVTDAKGESISVRCGGGVSIDWPALSASCSADPSSAKTGRQIIWSAKASGGNGTYSYSWDGDVSGFFADRATTYNIAGRKISTVTVTSGGVSNTSPACFSDTIP